MAFDRSDSEGQYGHLNLTVEFRASLCRASLEITWPQGIIMGGLSNEAGSLETGQVKTE